jgi:hypothetical protein
LWLPGPESCLGGSSRAHRIPCPIARQHRISNHEEETGIAEGTRRSNLDELTQLAVAADKVIVLGPRCRPLWRLDHRQANGRGPLHFGVSLAVVAGRIEGFEEGPPHHEEPALRNPEVAQMLLH